MVTHLVHVSRCGRDFPVSIRYGLTDPINYLGHSKLHSKITRSTAFDASSADHTCSDRAGVTRRDVLLKMHKIIPALCVCRVEKWFTSVTVSVSACARMRACVCACAIHRECGSRSAGAPVPRGEGNPKENAEVARDTNTWSHQLILMNKRPRGREFISYSHYKLIHRHCI